MDRISHLLPTSRLAGGSEDLIFGPPLPGSPYGPTSCWIQILRRIALLFKVALTPKARASAGRWIFLLWCLMIGRRSSGGGRGDLATVAPGSIQKARGRIRKICLHGSKWRPPPSLDHISKSNVSGVRRRAVGGEAYSPLRCWMNILIPLGI